MAKAQARERMNRWFQPHEGIAREVISADIQRYLGRDALVRPGVNEGQEGYWITAYRNLTTEMVRDLQQDSLRWRAEQQGNSSRRGAPDYTASQTHQSRQYYGPTETPAPAMDSPFGGPPPVADPYANRDPYGQQAVRPGGGYAAQPGYSQPVGYVQNPGYVHAQPGYGDQYQSPQSNYSQASYQSSNSGGYAPGTTFQNPPQQQPQYGGPQPGSQYVTSTTPQSFDAAQNVPRTAGFQQPPDPRAATAMDPYSNTAYRPGDQPTAGQQYYQQEMPTNTAVTYAPGHATVPPQTSSAPQYYSQYPEGRAVQPVAEATTTKRRHEDRHHSGGGHGRRR